MNNINEMNYSDHDLMHLNKIAIELYGCTYNSANMTAIQKFRTRRIFHINNTTEQSLSDLINRCPECLKRMEELNE